MVDFCTTIKPTAESTAAGFVNKIQDVKDYSPSTGASSSSLSQGIPCEDLGVGEVLPALRELLED